MRTKTLKISESLHRELKLFCAIKSLSMNDFMEETIAKELKRKGHLFTDKKK